MITVNRQAVRITNGILYHLMLLVLIHEKKNYCVSCSISLSSVYDVIHNPYPMFQFTVTMMIFPFLVLKNHLMTQSVLEHQLLLP